MSGQDEGPAEALVVHRRGRFPLGVFAAPKTPARTAQRRPCCPPCTRASGLGQHFSVTLFSVRSLAYEGHTSNQTGNKSRSRTRTAHHGINHAQVDVQRVQGGGQPFGSEGFVARDIVTRSTIASVGDFGLRFFDIATSSGRGGTGSFGYKFPAKGYQRTGSLHGTHGVHFRTAKILQHSIQQLCQLFGYRGESVGQVQQRNDCRAPSKAGLETVHADFETSTSN